MLASDAIPPNILRAFVDLVIAEVRIALRIATKYHFHFALEPSCCAARYF